MKICIISSAASVHTQKWANALQDRGHEVHIVTHTAPSGELAIPLSRLHSYSLRPGFAGQIEAAYHAVRIARSLAADITHLHSLFYVHPLYFSFWNSWGGRIRNLFVSTWGTDVIPGAPGATLSARDKLSKKALLLQASCITATSAHLARETAALACGKSVKIVPFGVDCGVFAPRKSAPHPIKLCFIKHLERRYGPDCLLKALSIVLRKHPDTTLTMAGSGSMAGELSALVKKLGLEDAVRFLGDIPNSRVPEILGEADIFVMPSLRDSFGVAALEAQAMGVPVVSTAVGGVPEAVRNGETGILVEPGNHEAFASAIIELIEDPSLRTKLGRAGTEFVRTHYNFSDNVSAMEALYREVVYA